MDAEALVADLDPDQRAAVTAESHLVAVVAGAGSGKTRVLTRRVAYRVATGDADARHTLVLTFTREAAGELRRRLHRLGLREHVEAGTFHSVMLHVLRQRWAETERAERAIAADARRLLREATGDRPTQGLVEELTWAQSLGLTTGDAYAPAARRAGRRPRGGVDAVAASLDAYAELKRRRRVIDFGDVLLEVLAEARRDERWAEVLRWRFRHLLVDEAQDLNPVQHRLIDLLREGRDDLFLVGDPSQAIYGFNGADPTVLTEVERRFRGVEVLRLPVNHRCTPQIVAAGVRVLATADQPVELRSSRPDGPPAELLVAEDEEDEARRVASLVARTDPNLVRTGSIAVLARTNAQLAAFATALGVAGVPVRRRVDAAGSPTDQALRTAASNGSPSALRAWAHDVLDDLDALRSAEARLEQLETVSRQGSRRPPAGAIADAADQVARLTAERRVATVALDFLRDRPLGTGGEFRTWVSTTNPFDDRAAEGVELLTFHAAKGREWHTVIVSGVETSLVPHRSATTKPARAEEARLLYVGLTRATDRLVVSLAGRRGGYARQPSPFIEGLDTSEPTAVAPPIRVRPRRPRADTTLAALRTWRDDAARRAGILPGQLCSDHDLSAIATHRPATADDLAAVTTMGTITAHRLAPDLLPLVAGDGGE